MELKDFELSDCFCVRDILFSVKDIAVFFVYVITK